MTLIKNISAIVAVALTLVQCQTVPSLAQSETSEDAQDGAKLLRIPTKAPEAPPLLKWADSNKPPRVSILCIHGLGLHASNYDAFGKSLAKAGIAVYAIDMRGFGVRKDEKTVDFDGSLADIKYAVETIKKEHPNLPVVVLGESMGGAIALRATALYPDLIAGLISSVPSGDRFDSGEVKAHIAKMAIFGGFNKPIDMGKIVVDRATQKPELREAWKNDPLGVMALTPNQLMAFDSFMDKNFEAAKMIKNAPVLFIQGAQDKLVRPAGTWKLLEAVEAPNKQMVLSKNSEHLIFEDNQFSPEDLKFVCTWLDKNVAPLDSNMVASAKEQPAVATAKADEPVKVATAITSAAPAHNSASTQAKEHLVTKTEGPSVTGTSGINYWIELNRGGKIYRCNNKISFKSGDGIRFHIISESDGYAYVVMKAGTSGRSAVLFPSPETGSNNHLTAGQDYPLPDKKWLRFDSNPGTEKVSLVFSKTSIDPSPKSGAVYMTAYVAPGIPGAKDLVPTRMQLSWDDPNPVIMPESFSGGPQLAMGGGSNNKSLVRLLSHNSDGALAVEIALDHQ